MRMFFACFVFEVTSIIRSDVDAREPEVDTQKKMENAAAEALKNLKMTRAFQWPENKCNNLSSLVCVRFLLLYVRFAFYIHSFVRAKDENPSRVFEKIGSTTDRKLVSIAGKRTFPFDFLKTSSVCCFLPFNFVEERFHIFPADVLSLESPFFLFFCKNVEGFVGVQHWLLLMRRSKSFWVCFSLQYLFSIMNNLSKYCRMRII